MRIEEKLIKIMQREGKRNNPAALLLGKMEADGVCNVSGQTLEREDYYIAEHLTKKICDKVDIEIKNGIIINKSTYIEPIQTGDTVLLYEIIKYEKYVIVEKVI